MPTLGLLVTYLIGVLSLSPSFLYLGIYYRFYYSLIRLPNSYLRIFLFIVFISSYLSFTPTLVYLGASILVLGPNLVY